MASVVALSRCHTITYSRVRVYTAMLVYVYYIRFCYFQAIQCVLTATIEPHEFLRHQLVVAGNTDTTTTSHFYSGSTGLKHAGGMPLEGKLRSISHTCT